MRFVEVIVFIQVCVFLSVISYEECFLYKKWNSKAMEMEKKVLCTRFCTESFRNTCEGKGFENLVEWQKCCKAIWKLDYIAWSKADAFMKVENQLEKGDLYYGIWRGADCEGEVYQRLKKQEEY